MASDDGVDLISTMTAALDGAEGLESDWLLDYSGRAEVYRQASLCLSRFIDRVWTENH